VSDFDFQNAACPLPRTATDRVLLAHGGGGRLAAELIERVFLPAFDNPILAALEDQATLSIGGPSDAPLRIAATTDSFVVRPLFFPGGDIGRLAICGTVNDLAVGGAIPKFLTAAFILEEGTPLAVLERVVSSMRAACEEAHVTIVAGDTKVVDRGKGDQIFIATTGIGFVPRDRSLSIRNLRAGDRILVSGTVGDHGVAVMSVREGLEFETELKSDVAPLSGLVEELLAACPGVRWMRDPTRGGVSSALNEAAVAAKVGIRIDESAVPVRGEVRAACEMLGLDPLYVANEGKLIAVVPAREAAAALAALRRHPLGEQAAEIGEVVADHPAMVTMKSFIGGERIVPMLSGEQLPRIC
jgi:hydrogenase expression/formation protein HypE